MFDFNYLHEEEINCLYILCKKLNDRKVDYVILDLDLVKKLAKLRKINDYENFLSINLSQ